LQEAAQQPFNIAFEYAAIGMALLGPDGRVQRANPALCDMLGYSQAELRRFGLQSLVHADDLEADAASRAALAAGLVSSDRRELRYRHKSGRTVWGILTRVLVRDPVGEPSHFIDQVLDLTERRRAEKEIVLLNNLLEQRIRRRTAELEESNEDLRDFAYSLAHDLRGPLASIDGFSAQLESLLARQAEGRSGHYLRRIRAGVRQMSELTDGLLALADIARTELQHQPVDLSEIARDILARLGEHEPQRGVICQVLDTPPARGDKRLLTDVLENLLGNAWKFTGRTADARISFGAGIADSGVPCYQVMDNGAGFDATYVDKLFAPFQRLHTASEFEGTGIGLAMVRKIVTRHGGRVWAESNPGEGATFSFTLGERQPSRQGDSLY
jgi:PAS domain S-box-containing protein